ncbi:hypothetical protein [Magnetospirillum sulfuroxidans]|uniref:Uncharacterized protein n=1 Tax=Magnetospirillum sulfuroxidans TaxID=611300 RepID=A0ABS5I8R7_9PROT|nr:hypothetical protein [Magnetospirillum sulfuroxidans]MBR9970840.1 hypothetical protein [Magnetospirillum sulfuroxidans]
MKRFEDGADLFGVGVGMGTTGPIHCDVCDTTHDIDERNSGVSWTNFAGLTIVECCFGKVEGEVLKRIPDIIPWFQRITARRRAAVESDEALLSKITVGP